jgi:DNA-binding beta-propeller fold protein YncE
MRSRPASPRHAFVAAVAALTVLAGCGGDDSGNDEAQQITATTAAPATSTTTVPPTTVAPTTTAMPFTVPGRAPLPGMLPNTDPKNIYANTLKISDTIKDAKNLVYVPHNESADVWVIDPTTFKVIDRYPTGAIAQHVVPSWDLKTLWVNNNSGNTLTPIDPFTGKPGKNIPVEAPYNMYFTPDGKYMIIMEERNNTMTFRNPATPNLDIVTKVKVPCRGINHADFSPDGTYFIATCEFSGQMVKFDLVKMALDPKVITFDANASQPQDVRLLSDGSLFLVADMAANGLWEIDGEKFEVVRFVPGDKGPHGIYPSRDAKTMIVSNRNAGSISVYDVAARAITKTWKIPGGGTPDMGGISADGKVFWVSGRNSAVVYAIDIEKWELLAKIPVGSGPHGLAVYPQPGRYSLGHTGNMR